MPTHYSLILPPLLSLALMGCCIHGSGDLEEEEHRVRAFENVDIEIPGTVYISRGEVPMVRIRTDDNIMDHLRVEVRGDTLVLGMDEEHHCIDPTSLVARVQTASLGEVDIDGAADLVIEDPFEGETMGFSIDGSGDIEARQLLTAERLGVRIDGSGDVDLNVDVSEMRTIIDGSGDLRFTGGAVFHHVDIDGSGDLRAFGLETSETVIDIDGSGDCRVTARDSLDVSIDGSGDVFYKGNPVVRQHISGSGRVENAN
jgi:hypothetical protein